MSQTTKSSLLSSIAANLADNTTGDISPQDIRDIVTNITDSMGAGLVSVTSNYTAADYPNILVSDASGNVTVTLPAASSSNESVYYIKKTNSGTTNKVIVDGNSSETIDGQATYTLYLQYDSIKIICDGSNWHILEKNITPHVAKITRNAVQTVSHDTITVPTYDNTEIDNAGISNLSTSRVTIKRAGKYLITMYTSFSINYAKANWSGVRVNGSVKKWSNSYSSVTSGRPIPVLSVVLDLSSGDYVEGLVYHNSGGNENTSTYIYYKPELTVAEIM